ncbi:Nif3-like dinuclear metal center hexameric protein [Thiohalobacter sp. IOR34]|uniref:Nif3-like dinuclear metal center hexameric protein n=1 Tax=Thiohalobacter sp. IOR34 TaxID=3057176 RepID=UPI0025AF34C3|nr:Nif3-like dinuclear metal center hexameric protein [Thiohalobacter sp. IOR34]WJW74840.1 Nif3-like dinuclear metal center hexameric protein [Thiohalobacter sp. IOR34]
MVAIDELVAYTDSLLQVEDFRDYCPNGLQVAGRGEVRRLISGVTASQALIDAAVAAGADALLVHHGWFWKGEDPRVIGIRRQRLATLLAHDISLLAYHLPLDAHPRLGNNVRLGELLGWEAAGRFGRGEGPDLALWGRLPAALTPAGLAARLTEVLGHPALHLPGGGEVIERIGWCTGAAQSWLEAAAGLGLDAFVSGEVSEPTAHLARELGIHYFAAGHHATERYGVQALGVHLAEKFKLEHEFIDLYVPV